MTYEMWAQNNTMLHDSNVYFLVSFKIKETSSINKQNLAKSNTFSFKHNSIKHFWENAQKCDIQYFND